MNKTKEERIRKLYDDASEYLTEESVKKYIGEKNDGFHLEIPLNANPVMLAKDIANNMNDALMNFNIVPGRCYKFLMVFKDDGPYDDSEEANVRRRKEMEGFEKKYELINAMAEKIRNEENEH